MERKMRNLPQFGQKMYNEMEKFVVDAGECELRGVILAAKAFLIGCCLFFMPALK